jgi:threonine-phosphate decarboxylase
MSALDFSINTNPFPLPRRVYEDLVEHFNELATRYVASAEHPAHAALAFFLGVPVENICLTAGATEAIFNIPRLFPAASGLIFPPSFWEYRAALQAAGSQVISAARSPETSFRFPRDVASLPKADMAFVANPDNPTSVLINGNSLLDLSRHLNGGLLVVDETYLLFRKDFAERTFTKEAAASRNVIVVASLSKFFNIPGLRAGYAVASPSVIKTLRSGLLPFSLNAVALYIIQRMLNEAEFVAHSRYILEEERFRVTSALRGIPELTLVPPEANFVLVQAPAERWKALQGWLASADIRVRWGEELDALTPDYFRMCVRKPEHNDALLSRLRSFFAGEVSGSTML